MFVSFPVTGSSSKVLTRPNPSLFDINGLKDEIISQINDRYEKLNFIDLTFHSKYSKKNIESIDFLLMSQKYIKCPNLWQTKVDIRLSHLEFNSALFLQSKNKHIEPNVCAGSPLQRCCKGYCTTFHGTNSHDTVKSIVDKGYIIPGMNPGALTVRKAHGSAYGIGVYSSPHFEKSVYYTTPSASYIYIVVNMLFSRRNKTNTF